MTQTAEAPTHSAADVPATPYVGLTPFTERDAPFFFGREKERRIIAANLMASRLTLLYGASGVGKSSIIRAGLQRDFRERAERAHAAGRFPESFVVVFNAWRDDPVAELAKCVATSIEELLGDLAPQPPTGLPLDELLAEWTRRLDERAAKFGPPAGLDEPQRTELLVVLDQFEQYFVYHPDEDGPGTFATEFANAVNREDLRANFLISLREDAYTKLDRFEARIPSMFGSNLRIEHLDEKAATAAIEKPIEKYNELLGGEPKFEIEPELVSAVLRDVRAGSIVFGQAGGGALEGAEAGEIRVETPFLQLVMSRLWEEERELGGHVLRLETLKALGGAEQIVRRHLEEAMSALDETEREVAARMLDRLVTPSGTRIVHSTTDLAGFAETTEDVARPILEKLDERRILRSIDPAPGEKTPRFEIRHDVLAGAVAEWNRQYQEQRRQAELEAKQRRELEEEQRRQAELAEKQRQELEEERRRQRTRIAVRVAAGTLVGFLVAVALAVLAWIARSDAESARDKSRSQALAAQALGLVSDDPEGSLKLAEQAREHAVTSEADGALRNALIHAPRRRVDLGLGVDRFHTPVQADGASFSNDARLAVISTSSGAQVWDWAGRRRLAIVHPGSGVSAAAISPDGTRLVIATGAKAGARGRAEIWDVARGRRLVTLRGHTAAVRSAAFSRDGALVVTAADDGTVRVWSARSGTQRAILRELAPAGNARPIESATFSPDARLVLATIPGNPARLWRWREHLVSNLALPQDQQVSSTAFSSDGRQAALAIGAEVEIWNVATGRLGEVLHGHTGDVRSVAFSPDGKLVVTASADQTLRVWDPLTGQNLIVLGLQNQAKGDLGDLVGAAFGGGSRTIVSVSRAGEVGAWLSPERRAIRAIPSWKAQRVVILSAALSPDGVSLATASSDNTARIWGLDGRLVRELPHGAPVLDASFSADGTKLVTAASDNKARIWSLDGHLLRELAHQAPVLDASFSADGQRIVTASADGTARIWDAGSGRSLAVLRGHTDSVNGAAFSPDGDRVATAGSDGKAVIWDARAGKRLLTFKGHEGPVNAVAFSPDGRLVATAGADGRAVIWDPRTGQPRVTLEGHDGSVNSVVFDSDGALVLTGSSDGTARVWDVNTGLALAVLYGNGGQVYRAAFGDRRIATVTADGKIRLFDCDVCAQLPSPGAPVTGWPPA